MLADAQSVHHQLDLGAAASRTRQHDRLAINQRSRAAVSGRESCIDVRTSWSDEVLADLAPAIVYFVGFDLAFGARPRWRRRS